MKSEYIRGLSKNTYDPDEYQTHIGSIPIRKRYQSNLSNILGIFKYYPLLPHNMTISDYYRYKEGIRDGSRRSRGISRHIPKVPSITILAKRNERR